MRVGASARGRQTSFKSLLILIRSGDICRSVFYPDTNEGSSTSKVVALSITHNRTCELILSASIDRVANAFGVQFAAGRIRRGGRITWRQPALYERRIKRE